MELTLDFISVISYEFSFSHTDWGGGRKIITKKGKKKKRKSLDLGPMKFRREKKNNHLFLER